MSEFRQKIPVNRGDFRGVHIGRICRVNIVCHLRARGVSHICLSVLFVNAEDIEISGESMAESVGRDFVLDAEPGAEPLQPFSKPFEVEVEHFARRRSDKLDYFRRYFHPARCPAVFRSFDFEEVRTKLFAVYPPQFSRAGSRHKVEQYAF